MTLAERVEHFQRAFPDRRASWPSLVIEQGRQVLYATWVIGNDYRNRSGFYGSYPPGYLKRVMALFPDVVAAPLPTMLHVFAGSVPAAPLYARIDLQLQGARGPHDVQGDVQRARRYLPPRFFRLLVADPPYTAADAVHYATPMIDRRRTLAALAEVAASGAHLCWLDCVWPIHSKKEWLTVGRILVQRSTNHRVRVLSIFERVA